MKSRNGFVSNSSSSSFVISKKGLTEDQIFFIENYYDIAKKMLDGNMDDFGELGYPDEGWNIESDPFHVKGSTIMDNFDMGAFLSKIGVADSKIEWSEY